MIPDSYVIKGGIVQRAVDGAGASEYRLEAVASHLLPQSVELNPSPAVTWLVSDGTHIQIIMPCAVGDNQKYDILLDQHSSSVAADNMPKSRSTAYFNDNVDAHVRANRQDEAEIEALTIRDPARHPRADEPRHQYFVDYAWGRRHVYVPLSERKRKAGASLASGLQCEAFSSAREPQTRHEEHYTMKLGHITQSPSRVQHCLTCRDGSQ